MPLIREELAKLAAITWDVIVIGGGISGAGVAREAARCGVKTLLLEQSDFAWGSSSRSSKMVHGGLRYLLQGRLGLVREAVHERERLLMEAPGLVERMDYIFPHYRGEKPYAWQVRLMLTIYDFFARANFHKTLSAQQVVEKIPGMTAAKLLSGHQFTDATTDDARLVIRVLEAAVASGASVRNYTAVTRVTRDDQGVIKGVMVRDTANTTPAAEIALHARVVINATGAWTDELRQGKPRIRPLRGSHIVIASDRCPTQYAILLEHPLDARAVFIYPWEDCTVVGTTDLDYRADLAIEPSITKEEINYLLAAVNHLFSDAEITPQDIRSTWSGVRPVIGNESGAPSSLSREHEVWVENGLFTIAGGKLTTFRVMAHAVLDKASKVLPALAKRDKNAPVLQAAPVPVQANINSAVLHRLAGWYGAGSQTIITNANKMENIFVANTTYLYAELAHSLQTESVMHLDDLLLRRTRIGLIYPDGGLSLLPNLKDVISETCHWDAAQWNAEVARYQQIWLQHYHLPNSAKLEKIL